MKKIGGIFGVAIILLATITMVLPTWLQTVLFPDEEDLSLPPNLTCEALGGQTLGLTASESDSMTSTITEMGTVAGYSGDALANAAQIIAAGQDMGVTAHGQTIGVMTAMGESSLRNIAYGDWETSGVRNPDGTPTSSLGLFQQQKWWGTREERMDPYTSATLFFKALRQVPGWESMPPTLAANATQHNADPWYYEQYWNDAQKVVAALAGIDADALSPCSTSDATTSAGGWTNPVPSAVSSSGYGPRPAPFPGLPNFHPGTDFAAPLGTPIFAAANGTVIHVSCEYYRGRSPCNIVLDHGTNADGHRVQTYYGHMYADGINVRAGDKVTAGQKIASVGSNGRSTGPHCHVEVWIDGEPVNPETFLPDHGVNL